MATEASAGGGRAPLPGPRRPARRPARPRPGAPNGGAGPAAEVMGVAAGPDRARAGAAGPTGTWDCAGGDGEREAGG